MKRLALLTIALFSIYASVSAQTAKQPEFFGGYSYESVNTGVKSTDFTSTTTSLDNRFQLNGIHFSAADYFTRRFGIAADFSAHFDNRTDTFGATTGQTKVSLYNITGGPQIRFPGTGRFTAFAQALAGVARRNLTETISSTTTSYSDNNTSFSMNFGGGVDYRLNKRFAWRIAQFDYNPIFLQSRTVNSVAFPSRTLNGFRFSTGIVIK
jgi:hypothetical protein